MNSIQIRLINGDVVWVKCAPEQSIRELRKQLAEELDTLRKFQLFHNVCAN